MSPRTDAQNKAIQDRTRLQILMAALQAFAERGYAHTTVSYLAKEAGVSKGLIYHYFDSKQQVLLGIFDMLLNQGKQIMASWEGLNAAEKLAYTIDQSLQFMTQQKHVMRFMLSLAVQPNVVADLEEVMEKEKKQSLERYMKIFKELGYDDPEQEAYFTAAILDGSALGLLGVKNYPIEKIKNKLYQHYQL